MWYKKKKNKNRVIGGLWVKLKGTNSLNRLKQKKMYAMSSRKISAISSNFVIYVCKNIFLEHFLKYNN